MGRWLLAVGQRTLTLMRGSMRWLGESVSDREGSMEGMRSGRLACLRMGVLSWMDNNILLALARIHTKVARGAR